MSDIDVALSTLAGTLWWAVGGLLYGGIMAILLFMKLAQNAHPNNSLNLPALLFHAVGSS